MRFPHGAATRDGSGSAAIFVTLIVASCFPYLTSGISDKDLQALRVDTLNVFYHGFDNYMKHAFPEDELKPVSCVPLTRDAADPGHVEVNDVLGNYSLTLIDSLSTLAIFASSDEPKTLGRNPLSDFQKGIISFVDLYGDGTNSDKGQGRRSRGFDLDSKVQVFETVIRGVGGLLSAHQFAIGDLPIRGYRPKVTGDGGWLRSENDTLSIKWSRGFSYDGQLLRLARDLASRLLPAFDTPTGLPYPRVNLRYGAYYYQQLRTENFNVLHPDLQTGSIPPEITETCSAGAGSLVLEFTTLSRLTGDARFEKLAKRAFQAVWDHRSELDLIGAGIDAETGLWVGSVTGIGAGIDSFFEYAFKSYILLSGANSDPPNDPDHLEPDFLGIWDIAHESIKRHLYRGAAFQHPHYIQGDLNTGAAKAFWIDSLSAYYPGVLALAGHLDEAVEAHLLYAALWSRYAALPERWSAATGNIDSGLKWWPGRPEFIESTWYLYRATSDPWYLHVGKMTLLDIKKRCWTPCGWAGLEDVRTGELKDRMESFFLGETVKYLYLLFDPKHPLNLGDEPITFTTEGHPITLHSKTHGDLQARFDYELGYQGMCPLPPEPVPFSVSAITSRKDFYHAASLARLHRVHGQSRQSQESVESAYIEQTSTDPGIYALVNGGFYPWTLPMSLLPTNGFSDKLATSTMFELSFPNLPNTISGVLSLKRKEGGVMINSVSNLVFSMMQERVVYGPNDVEEGFRIMAISHLTLGRDEKVFLPYEVASKLNPTDPFFTRYRDLVYLDLLVDSDIHRMAEHIGLAQATMPNGTEPTSNGDVLDLKDVLQRNADDTANGGSLFGSLLQHLSTVMENSQQPIANLLAGLVDANQTQVAENRSVLEAIAGTGPGAGMIPDVPDSSMSSNESLTWHSIFVSDYTCDKRLAAHIPAQHQVLVIRRGRCSFAEKLQNIPSFAPTTGGLQLVIVVSGDAEDEQPLIRPLIDEPQRIPGGFPRVNQIPLVMVGGGSRTIKMLKNARGVGLRRRYRYESQGLRISNLVIV